MSTELLLWHDATQRKPDCSITVLCWLQTDSDGRPGVDVDFECGYWESLTGMWVSCVTGDELPGVTHWAEPQGPQS